MRSTTPTYRVETRVVDLATGKRVHYTPAAWDSKQSGRPTDANLATWCTGFEASTQPGGCNAHLGIQLIASAQVVRQATGTVVASYQPGMFTAVA